MSRGRGSIETRGKDRHRIRIYLHTDAEGVQHYHRETFRGTKTQAGRRLTELLRQIDTGGYVAQTGMTVDEYMDRWMREAVRPYRKPKTIDTYDRACKALKATLGHIKLQKLRPLDLQSYYREALESGRADGNGGLSPSTVNIHHRTMHRALEQAVKWGLVARNVADAVEAPKARRRTRDVWTREQLSRFLDHVAGDRLYAMYATIFSAGLRRGEVCGMRRTDVDLDRLRLQVTQTLVVVDGECIFQDSAKTDESEKPLPISPVLGEILRWHLRRQAEERLAFGPDYRDQGLLFCRPKGRYIRPDNLTSKVFPALCERAGVPRIAFHGQRHTYASELLARKITTKAAQERMRHSSAKTTLDFYGHVSEEMSREAAAAMDDMLPAPREEAAKRRRRRPS